MASRKTQKTAGSVDRGVGRNRDSSRGRMESAGLQSRVLETKLDSLMSEVTDLTYNLGKISEKVEPASIACQSSGSSSQTVSLETKLNSIMLETTSLTSEMGYISESVREYKESINQISKSLPSLENRFRILESCVVRLQEDRSVQGLENRFSYLEKLLDKLKYWEFPAIETKVDISLNELRNKLGDLESIERRLNKLEPSENQTTADLNDRLTVLETSVNKIQDQDLPDIETRFNGLKSSLEVRQDKDKAEAKNDVHQLAAVVDVLCNDNLSNGEANTIKQAAERFGMTNTVHKLSSFFRNTLTLVTCIQLFKEEFGQTLVTHRNSAFKMILQNFHTLSETATDFCELSLEELRCVLYSSELQATAEQMFDAISKWVEKDFPSRTSMASLLLPAVQFSRCSLTFLRRIRDDVLVKAFSTVQHSVEEAIKKFGSDVLFVLGGFDSNDIIETLNKSKSLWIEQTNITNGPCKRTFAFTAEHKILVLEKENERLRSFDTLLREWSDLRPLPVFRFGMSAAMEENEIFFIGGDKHESRCDVYDIHLDSWTEAADMNVGRRRSASSSLKGKIYCCGGRGGDGQCLSSMEVLDPKENSKGWTMTASISVRRSGHCLVSCGQYLWALGGLDGWNYLADLERFEPWNNSWTKMVSMLIRRSSLTACFFEGRLYAIGGCNGKFIDPGTNTVEVYDPDENRWTTGTPLNRGRHRHATCVVKYIPNADEYKWFVFLII